MKIIVNKVIFDAVIKGKEYKDIVLDWGGDEDITEECIHDEDGLWCTADLEGDKYVCDFQVFANPDEPNVLKINCYEMYEGEDGYWHHGDFLYEDKGDFSYSNIRVEYSNKVVGEIVNKVIFDAVIKGKEYKDIVLDWDGDEDITEEYIHDEDGPWCTADLEGDKYVCDFQVFADPDEPNVLKIDCCEMYEDEDGYWHHGDFLYEDKGDFSYSNIRVEYSNKVVGEEEEEEEIDNVEIFKECEDGKLTMEEVDLILQYTEGKFMFYNDRANGYIAFALANCDREDADNLVNLLNERSDEDNWYLGDPCEEYVFV